MLVYTSYPQQGMGKSFHCFIWNVNFNLLFNVAKVWFVRYFFNSLKSLDLLTMKNLDNKVNVIPVIAKADIISKSELQKFKLKVCFNFVQIRWLNIFFCIVVLKLYFDFSLDYDLCLTINV